MTFFDDLIRSVRKQGAPVTMVIIAAMLALTILLFFTQYRFIESFAFTDDWAHQPWTILTYPFAFVLQGGLGLIGLIFTVMWMIWTSATIEREIGSGKFAGVWVAFTLLPAIFLLIGAEMLRMKTPLLFGPLLPLAGTTVIWGLRNRNASIRLYMVIPITGFWLAMLTIVGTYINFAYPNPLYGIFAILHLGLAYLFADNRLPFLTYARAPQAYRPSKEQRIKEAAFFDDVRKREQERQEKERLRKLFERSFGEDEGR